MGLLPCGKLGNTETSWDKSTLTYGYNTSGQHEWYAIIVDTTTTFNNSVFWNNSLDWDTTSCVLIQADGRAVATHESGHVQGLGHTGDNHPAIMHTYMDPSQTYWQMQSDDRLGIQGIYPGNQPGTCVIVYPFFCN